MRSSWLPSRIRRVVASSSKHALLLLAAAVSAGGLLACGEGSGSTASTATPSVASTPATTSAPAASTPTATTPTTTATTTPTSTTTPPTTPRPGSPSGSASTGSGGGAASFRAPRGDNSIPDFGAEAPASERARATAALAAFLRARASGDWSTACSQLSATTRKQLETFTRASKGNAKGCGPVLAALSTGPAASRADTLTGGVAALRIKGTSAFALFHGPHNSKYVMPLVDEGGAWKMGQLAPLPYPLGTTAAAP
ncbi:MAG TPA: hypothetical protein VNY27_10335 [Solirubrobacteraceae bacterium]|nr:hypothetical protein [Solirubrobacteraceae bacterium]